MLIIKIFIKVAFIIAFLLKIFAHFGQIW